MRDALYIIALVTGALLFCAPALIAHWRKHHYRWPITVINLLLGLTGVGWIICLIWAVWPEDPTKPMGEKPVRLIKN